MANYIPTYKLTAQAKILGAFQAGELRYINPVTFLEGLKGGAMMMPGFEELKTRDDRAVEAAFRLRTSRALGSAPSHNHTGSQGDSQMLSLSWSQKTDVFASHLKLADRNIYSLDEMLSSEIENVIANFSEGMETAAIAHIFNNRNTAFAGANIDGQINTTQDVFEIPAAKEKRFAQIMKSIMHTAKYSGQMNVYCDTAMYNKMEYYANQGVSNSENLSFQYNGVNFIHSVGMYDLAAALVTPYTEGFCIAIPLGMFTILPWIPKQYREGVTTSVNEYGSILNPVDGLQYGVHKYEARADGSAVGGYTQDVKTEYQIRQDVAMHLAPLTSGTPAQAFAIVETLTQP